MAHGIFEELRSKDLILRICAHGARPLRTRGNRPPRALIAFREKPPSFAVRRIVHERPARLVPGFLLAPELPEHTCMREARRDGAVAVLDRVVPCVLGLLQRPVLLQESRAVVCDGIRIGKAVTRNLERLAGLLDAPGFLQRLREAPVPVLVEGKNLHGLPIARDRLVPFLLVPEASQLGLLTSRLLRIARLDKEEVRPQLELTDVADLLAQLAEQYSRRTDRELSLVQGVASAEVFADAELLRLALRQLLDNACKYSLAGSVIKLAIQLQHESVAVRVWNSGSLVPSSERPHIFER